jgi:D-tyrosyl-tRNA(Tyr) deacylase
MRALLQRVSSARVAVDQRTTGEIGVGLLVFVGFTAADSPATVDWMADKILDLRLFPDPGGKMNLSLRDIAGEVLVVSQFTLYGDATSGRRPSFTAAAKLEQAIPLYEYFLERLAHLGFKAEAGEFGAMMKVDLVNEGPVTLMLER